MTETIAASWQTETGLYIIVGEPDGSDIAVVAVAPFDAESVLGPDDAGTIVIACSTCHLAGECSSDFTRWNDCCKHMIAWVKDPNQPDVIVDDPRHWGDRS